MKLSTQIFLLLIIFGTSTVLVLAFDNLPTLSQRWLQPKVSHVFIAQGKLESKKLDWVKVPVGKNGTITIMLTDDEGKELTTVWVRVPVYNLDDFRKETK